MPLLMTGVQLGKSAYIGAVRLLGLDETFKGHTRLLAHTLAFSNDINSIVGNQERGQAVTKSP
jgi:hypothetical protein